MGRDRVSRADLITAACYLRHAAELLERAGMRLRVEIDRAYAEGDHDRGRELIAVEVRCEIVRDELLEAAGAQLEKAAE